MRSKKKIYNKPKIKSSKIKTISLYGRRSSLNPENLLGGVVS